MDRFQVLHIEPRTEVSSGLMRHIDRVQFVNGVAEVWVPDNADVTRTRGNVELIQRQFVKQDGTKTRMTIQQAIDKRIREAGIKHVKQNQYKCIEVLLSGSPDVMQKMSRPELLLWAKESVDWARRQFGEGNVVSADLHVDETTPHIHMFVVPIVQGKSRRTAKKQKAGKERMEVHKTYEIDENKLRLCCNEVYTTAKLYKYHDTLAREVSKQFGMVRGIPAEPGHKKKHQNSIEYNRELERQKRALEREIRRLSADADLNRIRQERDSFKGQLSSQNIFVARLLKSMIDMGPDEEQLARIRKDTTQEEPQFEKIFDNIVAAIRKLQQQQAQKKAEKAVSNLKIKKGGRSM